MFDVLHSELEGEQIDLASHQERRQVLDVLHSGPFADQAPAEGYAALWDRGEDPCSIRTMYRILADHQEVRERRNRLRHPNHPKPQRVATTPNQVWSWDITKLLGPAKGTCFFYRPRASCPFGTIRSNPKRKRGSGLHPSRTLRPWVQPGRGRYACT